MLACQILRNILSHPKTPSIDTPSTIIVEKYMVSNKILLSEDKNFRYTITSKRVN